MKDMISLNDGKYTLLVNVHTIDQCDGQPCVIHNPSNHHMATWIPHWDDHAGVMYRRCPHLHLHPDPDDVTYLRRVNRLHLAGHLCDGCCQPWPRNEIEGGSNARADDIATT